MIVSALSVIRRGELIFPENSYFAASQRVCNSSLIINRRLRRSTSVSWSTGSRLAAARSYLAVDLVVLIKKTGEVAILGFQLMDGIDFAQETLLKVYGRV